MFSVLILTKNEEVNIGQCIDSVSFSNDIVVFDSYSTDSTISIAKDRGARIFQRKFDNYGAQREAARAVDFKNDWVLALDADERPDSDLLAELKTINISSNTGPAAYRLRRKDYFLGRWIKYSSLYPSWFIRFYQHTKVEYRPRAVHEYPEVSGTVGALKGHLIHDSFSKGLEEWLHKHVHYSFLEARENVLSCDNGFSNLDWNGLLSYDPVRRRKAQKQMSFRLPFRPTLRFFHSYIVCGGFRDGYAGFQYAKMLATYEQMILFGIADIRFQSRLSNHR